MSKSNPRNLRISVSNPLKPCALLALCGVGLIAIGAAIASPPASDAAKPKPKDEALERTRKVAAMLDGIYKSGIVIITEHYVHDENDYPAGKAFKKLFNAAKQNGWHEVRLLDATGDPLRVVNAPKDGFERDAIKKLKAGAKTAEKLVEKDGKRFLRIATPVPVVMDKCVMCHDNYRDVKAGFPIGSISYTIPIE